VSSVCGSIARHSIPGVLTNPTFSWPVPSHFRLTTRYVLVHSQVTRVMPEFGLLLLAWTTKCFPNRATRSWHYLVPFEKLATDWQTAKLLILPRNFIIRFMPLQLRQITPSLVRKSPSRDFWNATSTHGCQMKAPVPALVSLRYCDTDILTRRDNGPFLCEMSIHERQQ
jgi:hypothetical protein